MRVFACLVLASCCVPAIVSAQSPLPPDSPLEGRYRLGPLQVSPRFDLKNLGIDTNIYNESSEPTEDFTATFRPTVAAGLRAGRGRLFATGWLDFVYFQDQDQERSVNKFGDVRAELRLNRFVPFFRTAGLDAKERPNSEIDLRARRSDHDTSTGAAVQIFSRTAAFAAVQRQSVAYDPGQVFQGADLATQLNNTRDTVEAGLRIALTSLTTMSLSAARERQEFDYARERDSDSTRYGVRFEFAPDAVIRGSALLGYRDFDPLDPGIRDYQGFVARAQVAWQYQDRTTIDVSLSRDLDYSIDDTQPYYIVNAFELSARQRVGGPFDVQVMFGRNALHYRTLERQGLEAEGDVDTTDTIRGGIGYWFATAARLGFNYEHTSRSGGDGRSYVRDQVFASLAYGF